jgi:hypothetical protein
VAAATARQRPATNRLMYVIAALSMLQLAALLFALFAGDQRDILQRPARAVIRADVDRFHQIAEHPGRPYRDFEVEYPPVSLGAIEATNAKTYGATLAQVGLVGFLVTLGVLGLLVFGWGEREAAWFLLLSAPLALFAYFRFDILATALAALAVLLSGRRREGGAALTLTAAIFTKIWPVVLVPMFLARRQWRALIWLAAACAVALGAWVAWAGWDAPIQVATFRHSHGWQVESTVGSVLWTAGSRTHFEGGALRVGAGSNWGESMALLAGVLVLYAIWRGEGGDRFDPRRVLASVVTIMLVSPILSPQYLLWLTPFAAIVWRDRLIAGLTLGLTAITTFMWFDPVSSNLFTPMLKGFVIARNAGLLALLVLLVWRVRRARELREEGSADAI